jgi:hypothetical protein
MRRTAAQLIAAAACGAAVVAAALVGHAAVVVATLTDGVHPNADGYNKTAGVWFRA